MTDEPRPHEPELPDEVAARRSGLRTGWTTGTCASAAAKAAAIGLASGTVPGEVEIGLPNGSRVSFPVEGAGPVAPGGAAIAVVVKDAGDDPDCTDGARMTATAEWLERSNSRDLHELGAGPGIGTITKPGLGLPLGAPAINPVPRRMILAALAEVPGVGTDGRAVRVVFSVPGGEEMAAQTSNERLGIVGGISILGTSGIVRPFSTAAYRASVVQQVDVAGAQGEHKMVLCTGARSERAAMATYRGLDRVCFVEVGDFTGIALRRCVSAGMDAAAVVAMAGKITKLAAGVMMTHWNRSVVDNELLARVAREAGAPAGAVSAATETATARHVFEVCVAAGALAPLERLCELAAANCRAHVTDRLAIEVLMVDFEGERVVARA